MSMAMDGQRAKTFNPDLRRNQEIDNPCLKEYNLSLKCLSDNSYVRNSCKAYFDNYQNCRHFWTQVASDRAKKNILPPLPLPHERTKVKNDYLKSPIVK